MARPDSPRKDTLPKDVRGALFEAQAPVEPPAGRASAMFAALTGRIEQDRAAAARAITVRASEGEWREFLPGVDMKVLSDDGRHVTWLARMAKGSRIPGHEHPDDEESLVLEGTVMVGDERMRVGDYQRMPAGSFHEECYTETGCLVLLRSPSAECLSRASR